MEPNPYEAPQGSSDSLRPRSPGGVRISVAGCCAGCASVLVILASGVLTAMMMSLDTPVWQQYLVFLSVLAAGWTVIGLGYRRAMQIASDPLRSPRKKS